MHKIGIQCQKENTKFKKTNYK